MGGPDSFGPMDGPGEALVLLGGNIGDVRATFALAERLITERAGAIVSRSRDHWTEPWGFADERLFLNRALIIGTQHDPQQLMAVLLGIEAELGRTREQQERYTARSIDIDILLIGDRVIEAPGLIVPHPRMHERAFALEPAADIAPHWVHPVLGRTVFELVRDLRRPA
jgi:2-amino-4-hydroxy-6-hydroxymethyldihydropteridine diphosphokinase